MRKAILLTTHKDNAFVRMQIEKLQCEARDSDVFVMYQSDYCNGEFGKGVPSYPFSIDSLNALNYNPIAETIVPGSNHFAVLQFFRDHPNYDYYWNIEYDVYFNGDWETLLSNYEDVKDDFVSSHIQTYAENPGWDHWDKMELNNVSIDRCEYIKSFNPVYRISCRALRFLDDFLLHQHRGHHELLMPTILHKEGFSISDLGGNGSFSVQNRRFYTPCSPSDNWYIGSTMRYRPLYKFEDITEVNMLYHPVKNFIIKDN